MGLRVAVSITLMLVWLTMISNAAIAARLLPERVTILMYNYVSQGVPVAMHCKSKDNDLGHHEIPYATPYKFDFKPNIFGKSLFSCEFYSPSRPKIPVTLPFTRKVTIVQFEATKLSHKEDYPIPNQLSNPQSSSTRSIGNSPFISGEILIKFDRLSNPQSSSTRSIAAHGGIRRHRFELETCFKAHKTTPFNQTLKQPIVSNWFHKSVHHHQHTFPVIITPSTTIYTNKKPSSATITDHKIAAGIPSSVTATLTVVASPAQTCLPFSRPSLVTHHKSTLQAAVTSPVASPVQTRRRY
ncbi:hypothetical protein ACFE04_007888 [Oxalis oulophora]